MHSAKSTVLPKALFFFLTVCLISIDMHAQENSPYSRYGIGDIVPTHHISLRGMGGASIADTNFRIINTTNPAAVANLRYTIFDFGSEIDLRTLRSTTDPSKFRSANTIVSYLQLGFPLTPGKWKTKNNTWILNIGMQPVSRINYKIEKNERLSLPPLSDSVQTIYEGDGGLNKFNLGTAVKLGNLRLGVTSGYTFGNRDFSTRKAFVNDSVVYYKSNTQSQAHFGGIFVNAGAQYQFVIKKDKNPDSSAYLNVGAYVNFKQSLKAREDLVEETFVYDEDGAVIPLDTVKYTQGNRGKLILPASYGIGLQYGYLHWTANLDYEAMQWNDYRYFGNTDVVKNSWVIRGGVQYYPANVSSYWKLVRYRIGGYYGRDYINLNDKPRPYFAATAGATFPITPYNRTAGSDRDQVALHLGLEFGAIGNNQSLGLKENITRISIGLTVNSSWFAKRSYF